ncbi:MAG: hypothetical protein NC821_04020 [Candidatus Omnitrophica bacterium]|nr:hypothetical protein [Candidatus Omnitrophota bacterium]
MKKYLVYFYVSFIFLHIKIDDFPHSTLLVGLRRIKEVLSLKVKLQPKLELVHLALPDPELTQAKQKFKDNQEELNKLADRLIEPNVQKSLELADTQVSELQRILRNYAQYSSREIEKETGFSKLAFPGLLYLWIEKGPFYKGKINITFGAHRNEADFEIVKKEWEKLIQLAEKSHFEIIFALESVPYSLEDILGVAQRLGINPSEILQSQKYDALLKDLLRKWNEKLDEIEASLKEGTLPPQSILDRALLGEGGRFVIAELNFVAHQKKKVIFERVSLQAFKETMLAYLIDSEITNKVLGKEWNLELYLAKSWQSIIYHSNGFRIRDIDFQNQIHKYGRPNTYVLSFRGYIHQIQPRIEKGYEIEENRPQEFALPPMELLIQKHMRGEQISEEEKRDKLIKQLVSIISFNLLIEFHPTMETGKISEIASLIAQMWREVEILELMDKFKKGGQEAGVKYFLQWIKNSSLAEEIKRLFLPPG